MDYQLIRARRRGAAMVEMALILPILVALTFGILEYGWMFYRVAQINLASRHGVRTAVRPAADQAEVETAIAGVMNDAGWATDEYDAIVSDVTVDVGAAVTVTVNVDYDEHVGLTGLPFLPVPTTVSGTATMAKEGPE
jgi:Flp pilus assembly protein TadG